MTYIMTVMGGNKELGKDRDQTLGLMLLPKTRKCCSFEARVAEGFYDGLAF
ncbi:MAG: hypothetical protein IPM83_15730, partial [Ignavibacteria bacterium]|nr:hypothetical protein [Ignavibacteria bacterium]